MFYDEILEAACMQEPSYVETIVKECDDSDYNEDGDIIDDLLCGDESILPNPADYGDIMDDMDEAEVDQLVMDADDMVLASIDAELDMDDGPLIDLVAGLR